MISFLSLFLGLVSGPQTVSLQVTASVAQVELLLDGERVAVLESPPWSRQIDLGRELAPHELVAIAYDAQGVELDRARQWINLPRQPAESTLVLEGGRGGVGRVARLSWESLVGAQPSAVRVDFDGRPLEVEDPRSIRLPPHDPQQLHFLRVELEFGGLVGSTAELTFGGAYADRVHTELTALPVRLDGRRKLPPLDELQGWFSESGRSLRAAAAEKGRAEVVIVRDRGAWERLRQIRALALAAPSRRVVTGTSFTAAAAAGDWFQSANSAWQEWSFQFLWPVSRRLTSTEGPYDVFPHSPRYPATGGSLHGWVTTVEEPAELAGEQRLGDAVAVAGVTAASGNRRRAVILVLGESPDDGGELTPWMARRYLDRLQVPLFVWSAGPAVPAVSHPWGEVQEVSTPGRLERATRTVFRALEQQRIVWLDGTHRPQDIVLEPRAVGVRRVREGRQSN